MLEAKLQRLRSYLRRKLRGIIFAVLPPVESWSSNPIDPDEKATQYKESLDDDINQFSGDRESLLTMAEQSYHLEVERATELDSKAENYIRNMGFVLGILSLIPVLLTISGTTEAAVEIRSWRQLGLYILFLYGVGSLFLSVYYSTKALQLRGYYDNFTAEGVREEIQEGNYPVERQLAHLLECKVANEALTNNKAFNILVAESLSRNGLVSIGLFIVLISLVFIPVDLPPLC